MAAIPPENSPPSADMTGDEAREHALRHGFVLDDSVSDLLLGGDDYPWEDVQASRRNRRLQAKHPVTEGKNRYLRDANACPKCQTPAETLEWFYFRSPKETWPMQCGVAGWMVVCDRCRVQANFFSEVMS
jgi:hypothetical protein